MEDDVEEPGGGGSRLAVGAEGKGEDSGLEGRHGKIVAPLAGGLAVSIRLGVDYMIGIALCKLSDMVPEFPSLPPCICL